MMKQFVTIVLALLAVQTHATGIPNINIGASSTITPYPGTTLISGVGIDLTNNALDLAAKVTLTAGNSYTIATNAGFLVVATANADSKVWVGVKLEFPTLPAGFSSVDDISSLGFGAKVAVGVFANVTGALSNVKLVSPPLPLFGAQITAGINAGVLALDSQNVFSALVATFDPESKRITVSLPVTLPVIIFGKAQAHVSAQGSFSAIAGANQTIDFDAGASVTFRSQVANTITVAKFRADASAALAVAAQAAGKPLGTFFNISLAAAAAHDSTIRISYNASDLIAAGIADAASVKLAFFDEVNKVWNFGTWETIVNKTAQYFEARVPHFSTWAPIAIGASSTITPYPGTTLISGVSIDLTNNALDSAAKVTLVAGNSYTIATNAGFLVVVTANADAKVWVGVRIEFPTLPAGFSSIDDITSLGFGAKVAVGVFANVTGALTNVKLVSPPLPLFGAQITAGINAGVLALDQSTNVFSALVATFDPESKRITVSLPVTLPVIIFGKAQAHVSAHGSFSAIAGANQTIDFDAGASVTFRSQVANTITVAKFRADASAALAVAAQAAGKPLGTFFNISLAAAASHDSTIRISYNASDLIAASIADAASVKLAFFDEVNKVWNFGSWETIVNKTAQYFEARVPHFSTWAPIAIGASSTITPYPGTTLISNVAIDLTNNALDSAAKVTLVAGNSYTIATSAGFLVVVTANADAKVWVGVRIEFPQLPAGWASVDDITSLGFGAKVAVGLFANVTGALSNIQLISPPLPLFGAQITAGINAGVLALDQTTNVFSALVATYDPESKRITVSLPVNLPVIIFGKVQAHVSAKFNSIISTIAGANQTLDFDAGTSITFRSQVANTLVVAKTNAAAAGSINAIANQAGRPLGIYLNISLGVNAAHDSSIRITYNKTDLIAAGIQNEANLKLAFYNEVTKKWDFGDWKTTVDTIAHTVSANVPHFSTWAPIEQTPQGINAASQASVSILLMTVLAFLALFQ